MSADKRRLTAVRWALPLLVLAISFWLTLFCRSAVPIGALEALRALLPGQPPTLAQALVLNLRLPRSLVALLLGASLALAGSLLQTLTRNPLASPSLFGINAGASLAMVLVSAFSPQLFSGYSIALVAAVGGGLSWGAVMLLGGGWQQAGDRSRLILAGVAVSALCAALTKATLILSEDHAYGILNWLAGGVAHARWPAFWQLFPFTLIIAPICMLLASRLNLLQVSDESAHTLGVNLPRMRLMINLLVLLLVGACVSVAGPPAFIGLLVPHMARGWIGYDLRRMLPISMLFGASLMLLADLLARFLAWPGELPAGAVLALIGAPFFVWLVRRRA
ncbi:iron complex transport system permease protein [Erwinia toletana]|uniref:Iron complex transport system permease protein n=1 Tax=Winslowiella toletana TaxID=92490 RepID=A0ABS4P3N2_9GAMM|nr:iron-dicitrate ABC transporter permease FecC [Winslowiella toletana]MBP2167273.1 iron complex transport system permease protein [Winslowiella toletana]